jgi:murein DD-endopeptidase MepM/ murein hydrolase activator NlpD
VKTPSLDSRRVAAASSRFLVLLAAASAALAVGAGVALAQSEVPTTTTTAPTSGATTAEDTVTVPADSGDAQPANRAGGGTLTPGDPRISDVVCVTRCIKTRKGVKGSRFRITGTDLQDVVVVSLPRADGKRAKDMDPTIKPSGAVVAYVQKGAITGPAKVADSYGQTTKSPGDFKVGTYAQLRQARAGWRFPIRGPHTYGDHVGAPRGDHTHQGQDIAAACGTKLVAARGGRVQYRGYQAGGAGNYIVIDGYKTSYDFVYMHLKNPALFGKGQTVATGQMIGKVGTTGSSTGCHLHFEMWSAPGWYEGGHFIDPYPYLKQWDKFS